MKFKTQHIRVMGKNGYNLHRDGNVTWKTGLDTTRDTAPYDVVTHKSVGEAKAVLGRITSAEH